jgi:SWI/SNF-related matrix-associated actin-dependent regulator of chromatin subfamily A3
MVHIVEPQWNPAIEEQAIARVVRMGQKRPVTIFKYITAGSIENVSFPNFIMMLMETNGL